MRRGGEEGLVRREGLGCGAERGVPSGRVVSLRVVHADCTPSGGSLPRSLCFLGVPTLSTPPHTHAVSSLQRRSRWAHS